MGGDHTCYGCGTLAGGSHEPTCPRGPGKVTEEDCLHDPTGGVSWMPKVDLAADALARARDLAADPDYVPWRVQALATLAVAEQLAALREDLKGDR